MKVYRCCSVTELNGYKNGIVCNNEYGSGTNTFVYDKNVDYIHFFLFAECMFHYKKNFGGYYTNYFVEYDIPLDILKKYFGYGFYEGIIPGFYTPVPEFALPCDEFKVKFISDISCVEKDCYLRNQAWDFYISSIPREYLADYECGSFKCGYDEYSVLDYDINKVFSLTKTKLSERIRDLLR